MQNATMTIQMEPELSEIMNVKTTHTQTIISSLRKTKKLVRIRFFTKPSKNLTAIQTVFRQKLHAIQNSN